MATYAEQHANQSIRPLLMAIPIGAWASSLVLDVVTRLVDGGSTTLTDLSYRLVGLGIIAGLGLAVAHAVDLRKLDHASATYDAALTRLAVTLATTLLFIANFVWREFRSFESQATPGLIALSLLGLVLLGGSLSRQVRDVIE